MRLALKFTIAFLAGMCLVLAVYGYSISRREIAAYTTDMKQDHRILGCALALAVSRAWEHAGEAAALQLIRQANTNESSNQMNVRWVWIDRPGRTTAHPPLSDQALTRLRNGQTVMSDEYDSGRTGHFVTFVPVTIPGTGIGAVEITESLAGLREYTRETFLRILTATGAVIATTGMLAVVLGFRFVGRPVGLLISHARSVAAGDLSSRLHPRTHDELRELAEELNGMSDQLAIARERIAAETAARISTIEQLRHADRLTTVGQLASGIAHELGTPLNVVWARAEMIASGKTAGDGIAANARIIIEQSQRMTRIIRQLLDFARPRNPRRTSTDLGEIARQTASLLKSIAAPRDVAIEVDDAGQTIRAEVDADQMQQVLSNLVLNGIQAMRHPGAVTIRVGTQRIRPPADLGGPEDEYAFLSITDQGEGIADVDLPRVFEPFFTTKQVGEGTGLGLSVSRGIVREHRGWISVASRPGEGSCFSVYLPRERADAPAMPTAPMSDEPIVPTPAGAGDASAENVGRTKGV
jgi:two-component system NtrC family sensor kinase